MFRRVSIRAILALLLVGLLVASFGAITFAQDATEEPDVVEIEGGDSGEMADLSGTITISFQGNDTQTWEAVCAAYEGLHPNVDCVVELKPAEGYQDFIRAQFAGGSPAFSFVNANVVADLVNDKQFLDLSAYLDRTNPYTNTPWRENFAPSAFNIMRDPLTGEMYMLNLETVQTL
jgi:ABC-type glycerol-3-phosphate transport system substrate-binding protein